MHLNRSESKFVGDGYLDTFFLCGIEKMEDKTSGAAVAEVLCGVTSRSLPTYSERLLTGLVGVGPPLYVYL